MDELNLPDKINHTIDGEILNIPFEEEKKSRLEEIKEEYLKQTGFETWAEMSEYSLVGDVGLLDIAIKNVSEKYATECIKASFEKSSENALVRKDFNNLNNNDGLSQQRFIIDDSVQFYEVDKKSITNPENIVLL